MKVDLKIDPEMLPLTIVPDRSPSDAEFQDFCFDNDLVQIERRENGEIRIFPLFSMSTSIANADITAQLMNWWHTHRRGNVVGSSAGFFLPDGSMLCPNVAYVSSEKVKGLTRPEWLGIPHVCPDFVIELLSDWEDLQELQSKMSLWIANGTALAWLIDPNVRAATIFQPGRDPFTLRADIVGGSGPVDGFELNLEEVWESYEM